MQYAHIGRLHDLFKSGRMLAYTYVRLCWLANNRVLLLAWYRGGVQTRNRQGADVPRIGMSYLSRLSVRVAWE